MPRRGAPGYPGSGGARGGQDTSGPDGIPGLLAAIHRDLRRAITTHVEGRLAQSFVQSADGVAVAAAGSATVLTVPQLTGSAWRIQEVGFALETGVWDDGTLTTGVHFSFLKAGSPVVGLDRINFPLGTILERGRVHVVGNPAEVFSIVAFNSHPTAAASVCCAVVGMHYSTYEGGA